MNQARSLHMRLSCVRPDMHLGSSRGLAAHVAGIGRKAGGSPIVRPASPTRPEASAIARLALRVSGKLVPVNERMRHLPGRYLAASHQ